MQYPHPEEAPIAGKRCCAVSRSGPALLSSQWSCVAPQFAGNDKISGRAYEKATAFVAVSAGDMQDFISGKLGT